MLKLFCWNATTIENQKKRGNLLKQGKKPNRKMKLAMLEQGFDLKDWLVERIISQSQVVLLHRDTKETKILDLGD